MEFVTKFVAKLLALSALISCNVSSEEVLDSALAFKAVPSGNPELILSKLGPDFDVKQTDEKGQTLLFNILFPMFFESEEIQQRTRSVIEELLKKGMDVNHVDYNGSTCLHFIALFGTAETMKLFLKHGANVNIQNKQGNTALHVVLPVLGKGKSNFLEKLSLLLKYGGDEEIENDVGALPQDFWDNVLESEIPKAHLTLYENILKAEREQDLREMSNKI